MSSFSARLEELGLALPPAPAPAGAYVPAVASSGLVFTAGQLPLVEGSLITSGHVGREVPLEMAQQCARACVLNALAAASTVCELDLVRRVVKVTGYVASAPGFTSQPKVIDAASELLVSVLGDAGRHAREAVGVAELPLGAPVEISLVLELG